MASTSTTNAAQPHEQDLFLRLQTLDEMVRATEESEHRLQRIADRRRIPPVPDLRFEYSYVRSVAPHVHIERAASPPPSTTDKGKEKAAEGLVLESRGLEIVRVDWGRILWITTRDQVVSPLLQGALWGVASHFMSPLGAVLGAHIRAWWARGAARGKDAAEIEGNGVQWLRNWMGSILSASVPTVSSSSRLH